MRSAFILSAVPRNSPEICLPANATLGGIHDLDRISLEKGNAITKRNFQIKRVDGNLPNIKQKLLAISIFSSGYKEARIGRIKNLRVRKRR